MRQEVIVSFSPSQRYELALHAGQAVPPPDEGRRWLDAQFLAHDCEPLRASGKVLVADKVLALAQAAGPQRFAADADWSLAFARATLGALARPVVRVDVAGGALSY